MNLRRWAGWIVKGAALVAWAGLAVWTFSFSFSSSFFHYNLPSRLPAFLAAVLGAVALPVSVWVQWRRALRGRSSRLVAWLVHALSAGAALVPLLAISAVLARAPEPFHPSADDAMGVGIDFLILAGAALASVAALGLALQLVPRRPYR